MTPQEAFKYNLITQIIDPEGSLAYQRLIILTSRLKRPSDFGPFGIGQCLVIKIPQTNLGMKLMVYLLEDVADGDAVGMNLINIEVPWKSGVKKAAEGTGRLASELCEVDVIMLSAEF